MYFSKKSQFETVSIRGIITTRSYRIDHMSLAGNLPVMDCITANPTCSTSIPSPPSSSAPPTRTTNKCKIMALTVQSTLSADTLMVYLEFRQGVPLPLGLLPGSLVTLHNLRLKMSRTGNYYCTSYALTSIRIHSMDVQRISSGSWDCRDIARSKLVHLSTSYLGDLTLSLIKGHLSRSMVCLRVGYMTTYRVQLARRCRACQQVLVGGRCSATCVNRRPTYEASIRLVYI